MKFIGGPMHGRDVEALYEPDQHPSDTLIVEIKTKTARKIVVYEQRPWLRCADVVIVKAMALAELTDEQFTALGREVLGPC